jgi:hypothetical protein
MKIESEKIASAERIKAAELAANRQNKMLELAAGILSARSGIRGQNITNDSTLDQTGAAATSPDLDGAISQVADVARRIDEEGLMPRPKKAKAAKFTRLPDGGWHAKEIDED